MAMRTGWTFNGKHFTETRTCRMGMHRIMFFIDGKPASEREWRLAMKVARDAEAVAQVLEDTGAAA